MDPKRVGRCLVVERSSSGADRFRRRVLVRLISGLSAATVCVSTLVVVGSATAEPIQGSNVDVVFANFFTTNRICLGDGIDLDDCSDVSDDAPDLVGQSAAVAIGDLNEDGYVDAIFANSSGLQPDRFCLGDGVGGLDDCANVSADLKVSSDVKLGDVNNDGHLDAVFAMSGSTPVNRLCLGDGALEVTLTCSDIVSAQNADSFGVALGDIDGDGNLDAVFATRSGTSRSVACLGDGTDLSDCSEIAGTERNALDVALGDVNNDGNLDAVFANRSPLSTLNTVCLGNGATSVAFTCADVSNDAHLSAGVALGDVDNDGNVDAVFANLFDTNRVCLGDGTGSLDDCSNVSTDTARSEDLAFGDVDGDGNLDLVFANEGDQRNALCYGNGAGSFSCGDVSADARITYGVAFADLGRNQDPAPTANAGGPYLAAVDEIIQLDGTDSSDPTGDLLTFTWDYDEDGLFDDAAGAAPSYSSAVQGIFTVGLQVADPHGGIDTDTAMVVVYDADGGFVTGGGTISSPAGAYQADPSLTGAAHFGFVSKYKMGASAPMGQTEFQFQVAELNFQSDRYDWLVVAGPQAKFKGTGTINGSGNYGFMISATDAALTPSTDTDRFRIRIWDEDDGDSLIYDNEIDAGSNDPGPSTTITGGSIVIHKG